MKTNIIVALLLVSWAPLASAACDGEEYRQFDFWLGAWEVTNAATGKVAGVNKITRHLGSCALHEHYKAPGGYEGTSVNIYDKSSGQWHQTWVDNSGLLLNLNGGLKGKKMVLEGTRKAKNGALVNDRITWSLNNDGSVRQHWQLSRDSGETWTTLFDGTYTKKD